MAGRPAHHLDPRRSAGRAAARCATSTRRTTALILVASDRISAFDVVLQPGIPGQGHHSHAALELLVPAASPTSYRTTWWRPSWRDFPRRTRAIRSSPAGRASSAGCRPIPVECVAARLHHRLRLEGVPGERSGVRHPAARRAAGVAAAAGADLHAVHQGRRPATTRTSRSTRWSSWSGATSPSGCATSPSTLYRAAPPRSPSRAASSSPTPSSSSASTHDGRIVWMDEALTPDSSRFWPAASYRPGASQPSFDKQYVRDWLEATAAGTSSRRRRRCPPRWCAAPWSDTSRRTASSPARSWCSEPGAGSGPAG